MQHNHHAISWGAELFFFLIINIKSRKVSRQASSTFTLLMMKAGLVQTWGRPGHFQHLVQKKKRHLKRTKRRCLDRKDAGSPCHYNPWKMLQVWRPCCPLCSSSVHLFSPQVLEMPQISNWVVALPYYSLKAVPWTFEAQYESILSVCTSTVVENKPYPFRHQFFASTTVNEPG